MAFLNTLENLELFNQIQRKSSLPWNTLKVQDLWKTFDDELRALRVLPDVDDELYHPMHIIFMEDSKWTLRIKPGSMFDVSVVTALASNSNSILKFVSHKTQIIDALTDSFIDEIPLSFTQYTPTVGAVSDFYFKRHFQY